LTTSTQSRFCQRAQKTAPRAAPARSACAARTRTLRPDCRAPRKPPTPHLNSSWRTGRSFGYSASLTIPPRGTGLAAARCAAAESKALNPPPCATFIYVQAVASQVSLSIHAYHRPRPCPAPPPPPMRRCGQAVVDSAPQTPPDPGAHPSHPPPLLPPQFPLPALHAAPTRLHAASPTLPHRYLPALGPGLQVPLASMYSSSLELASTSEG
jgi:hypothetical protein